MNPDLRRLYEIAMLPERTIIGLMSGTSLDGLDVALCRINGSGRSVSVKVEAFKTFDYTEEIKNDIRTVFSKKEGRLEDICRLNISLAELHVAFLESAIKGWNIDRDSIHLIGSHGQTIFHAPNANSLNSTLQIVDGDHLAFKTGIITLSDFRQKHIAAGGEGAPLAVYGDYLLTGEEDDDVVWLNIGGMANLTFISKRNEKIITTDTGPGNTLMDSWMRKYYREPMDLNGMIASSGVADEMLSTQLYTHPWFYLPLPKTCGPEIFDLNYVEKELNNSIAAISHRDVMATLNELTAIAIKDVINGLTTMPFKLYISGGGLHNQKLMQHIREMIPNAVIQTALPFNIDPDAKEAVLFALLANEMIGGDPETWRNAGISPAAGLGKISFPH